MALELFIYIIEHIAYGVKVESILNTEENYCKLHKNIPSMNSLVLHNYTTDALNALYCVKIFQHLFENVLIKLEKKLVGVFVGMENKFLLFHYFK